MDGIEARCDGLGEQWSPERSYETNLKLSQ